jgi:hypothetical protein
MTLLSYNQHMSGELGRFPLHPVSLSQRALTKTLKVILFDLAKPKRKYFSLFRQIEGKALDICLVYVPFEVHRDELIQTSAQLRIEKKIIYTPEIQRGINS